MADYLDLTHLDAAPAAPPPGKTRLYALADQHVHALDQDAAEQTPTTAADHTAIDHTGLTGINSAGAASGVSYNHTTSGLAATNVQTAIDEVVASVPANAAAVTYDPTASGLSSTDVQAALDEVAAASGGGGGGVQRTAVVTLTNAQMLALVDTQVAAIAAPGAGLLILVDSVFWWADFSGGGYGNLGSASWQYASFQLVADPTGNFDYLTNGFGRFDASFVDPGTYWALDLPKLLTNPDGFAPTAALQRGAVSNWVNQPVVIGLDNPASGTNLTGGDAANTLRATISYRVLDTATGLLVPA